MHRTVEKELGDLCALIRGLPFGLQSEVAVLLQQAVLKNYGDLLHQTEYRRSVVQRENALPPGQFQLRLHQERA